MCATAVAASEGRCLLLMLAFPSPIEACGFASGLALLTPAVALAVIASADLISAFAFDLSALHQLR